MIPFIRPAWMICWLLLGAAGCFGVAGCKHAMGAPEQVYEGWVERVEAAGEVLDPRRGLQPLTQVWLRVRPVGSEESLALLRVSVTGLYVPTLHGREGDRVAFGWRGPFPWQGALAAETVGYRVVR